MRLNYNIRRSSNGNILDIALFKDGREFFPEKKIVIPNEDGTHIIYIYLSNIEKWMRILITEKKYKINYVNNVINNDLVKLRKYI